MTVKTIMIAAFSAAMFATSAQAITVFSGQDNGALIGGVFTNSAAAEAAFLAAAGGAGTVTTETFETRALGYYSPIAIDSATRR